MLKKTRKAPSIIRAKKGLEDILIQKYAQKFDIAPEILKEELQKKKEEDDEEMEFVGEFDPFDIFGIAGKRDREALEDRGIIIINSYISKETLARATRRMLVLHFDEEFTDDIQVVLNSPGGFTDGGWAFIDTMRFVKNKVITVAMGEICSMATSIFIAGDYRIMAPHSTAMIHQFAWYREGNYSDLVAGRKMEDLEQEKDIQHLIDCSKYKSEAEVKKHLLKEYDNWLSPKEMKKHGLCDEISKPKTKVHKKGKR